MFSIRVDVLSVGFEKFRDFSFEKVRRVLRRSVVFAWWWWAWPVDFGVNLTVSSVDEMISMFSIT